MRWCEACEGLLPVSVVEGEGDDTWIYEEGVSVDLLPEFSGESGEGVECASGV